MIEDGVVPGARFARDGSGMRLTARHKHSFRHHDNFSSETTAKPSRNLANDGALSLFDS